MPIKLTNLNTTGVPPVKLITDTFSRSTLNATNSQVWTPVIVNSLPTTTATALGFPFCNGLSQLVLSGLGTASPVGNYYPCLLLCSGLTFKTVNGNQQFCQATFQSVLNAAGIACGPAVMINASNVLAGASWYGLVIGQSSFAFLERCSMSGGTLTTTTLFTDGVAKVAGDIWRLSFNPATNTPTLTKNGTVVYNTVDGSPLTGQGVPGFHLRTVLSTAGTYNQVIYSNASCGVGA